MNISEFKTIAAIATPAGYGGIGIIRLSGGDALTYTQRLFRNNRNDALMPQHATLRQLVNPESGDLIDEAVITYFKSPHSYTGEDVVEISCHGSPVVLSEILRLLVSFGVELAQPGEFSLRAFLNQRLDLTQAEAIKDLIHAQTTYQARLAALQLRGELSRLLKPIKEGLIELIVHFESSVEFVEDDLDPINLKLFIDRIDNYISQLSQLAESYKVGKLIRSGIRLALIGRPNVGKSSLFNRLLGRDRAIVTHLPGTTRDTLNEPFAINGIPINLIDTAGIRETEDLVEKIGVERTKAAIDEADFIIGVVEITSDSVNEESRLFDQFPVDLWVLNKSDLDGNPSDQVLRYINDKGPVLNVSALTGQGISELKQFIYDRLISESRRPNESAIITNERHFRALEDALFTLQQAKKDLSSGFTEEVALANLHQALRSLGVITGETLIADIINQIFSTFCIGK